MVRDINPQFMNGKVIESAANTFTQAEISLPVVHDLGNGKALVVELLKVFYELSSVEPIDNTSVTLSAQITKDSQAAMILLENASCIFRVIKNLYLFDTGATDATVTVQRTSGMHIHDYTDGNGNGYLLGKTKIFLGIKGTAFVGANVFRVKLLYRMKQVSAQELIGIIQE